MVLQSATSDDLTEIVSLVNRSFRGSVGWAVEQQVVDGARITLPALREQLAATPEALQLVWRDDADGALLGSVWLEALDGAVWYMGLLCVEPEQQARQLGRTLLTAAEETAKERGARRMRISVLNVRDTLMGWYERRGYVRTGETQAFPYGDNSMGTPMRDDLYFVVLEKAL